jgi:hypothetical protein
VSSPTCLKRAGIALAVSSAFVAATAAPVAAQTPVNLATASPFVVLGGSTVTNTGPSVLNGALGVAPGTALVGFGSPAVVNGATHDNDAVASQAQADLTTAYTVAAAAAPATDLSNTDLGNRTLIAGAYRYTSAAQLTGVLTLDAQNNPNAQFVFAITSALTTASASSVVLINGASPCNVFWQVGSSATLGSTTAFQGNLMALTSISLANAATVRGRLLARNGQVSLINNVIDGSMCGTSTTATPGTPAPGGSPTTRNGTALLRRTPGERCIDGFHARVRGRLIRRVVFSMDGRRLVTRNRSPFSVFVRALSGSHNVRARVTFTDATPARTLTLRYRACAAAVLQPRRGPSQFTG